MALVGVVVNIMAAVELLAHPIEPIGVRTAVTPSKPAAAWPGLAPEIGGLQRAKGKG